MPASLASLCNYSWDLFVSKAQKIHQSSVWSSFSKKIIEGYQMDLHFVVTDDHYSAYFKQYLLHSPGDAESLSCWRDIRHVLSTLLILKKPPPHSSTTSSSSSSSSSPSSSLNSKKYSSYTPTLASPTSSSSLTSSNPLINYPHPYEPLSILLECLRKYFTLLIRGTCNAITQSTKIKLTALSQQTNSIRTIQSLDLSYAAECCVSIESVLTILMGECYQHLLERYEEYLLSNEYIAAIASIRLRQSEIVQLYLRQNVFLGEVSDTVFCLLLLLLSLSSSSLLLSSFPPIFTCPVLTGHDRSQMGKDFLGASRGIFSSRTIEPKNFFQQKFLFLHLQVRVVFHQSLLHSQSHQSQCPNQILPPPPRLPLLRDQHLFLVLFSARIISSNLMTLLHSLINLFVGLGPGSQLMTMPSPVVLAIRSYIQKTSQQRQCPLFSPPCLHPCPPLCSPMTRRKRKE
jgi:hypothetical protein